MCYSSTLWLCVVFDWLSSSRKLLLCDLFVIANPCYWTDTNLCQLDYICYWIDINWYVIWFKWLLWSLDVCVTWVGWPIWSLEPYTICYEWLLSFDVWCNVIQSLLWSLDVKCGWWVDVIWNHWLDTKHCSKINIKG